MAFDIEKFSSADLKQREAEVSVPELKDFFGKDEPTVWIVKGLTGEEHARVNDAVKQNKDLGALVQSLFSSSTEKKVDAIREAFGMSDEVPDDIVRRIAILRYGSVSPECSQELAVKIAKSFVIVLFNLTTKIMELTGLGSTLGELKASGQTKESEQP